MKLFAAFQSSQKLFRITKPVVIFNVSGRCEKVWLVVASLNLVLHLFLFPEDHPALETLPQKFCLVQCVRRLHILLGHVKVF